MLRIIALLLVFFFSFTVFADDADDVTETQEVEAETQAVEAETQEVEAVDEVKEVEKVESEEVEETDSDEMKNDSETEKIKPVLVEEKSDKKEEKNSALMKVSDGKPLKYFELYGYFAFANKFTYNMSLNGNNPYLMNRNTIRSADTYDDADGEYKLDAPSKENVLSWAWLKLHLEPVINVAETLEIHTKMSIFGNTALGADNFEADKKSNGLMRDAQLSTSADIVFEGLWGSVDTPIGELKAGRMPFHWGLGLLYNDGNRINHQSTGNYLDRIQLTIPVAGFKIIPAFDIASTGLLDKYHDYFIDSSQKDDGYNISAMFMMNEDDPQILENKLLNEQTVVEFGAMVMFSWKGKGSGEWKDDTATIEETDDRYIDNSKTYAFTNQDAQLWKIDGWFNLHHKNFSLKTELAFITGTMGKMLLDDGKTEKDIKAEMVGVAMEMEYRAIPKKFHLSLFTGLASPDDADLVQADTWGNPGNSVNNSSVNTDSKVQNYRFNKDYDFNSVLWNQFLGRFSAGYYASLFGTYYIIDELKIDLGVTYSMALQENNSLGGRGLPSAIEPFIGIDYANKSGLRGGARYQLGVPFSGLEIEDGNGDIRKAELFHYLNVYLGIVF
jgi:uncharacterized protein (TIGR04551 family)